MKTNRDVEAVARAHVLEWLIKLLRSSATTAVEDQLAGFVSALDADQFDTELVDALIEVEATGRAHAGAAEDALHELRLRAGQAVAGGMRVKLAEVNAAALGDSLAEGLAGLLGGIPLSPPRAESEEEEG